MYNILFLNVDDTSTIKYGPIEGFRVKGDMLIETGDKEERPILVYDEDTNSWQDGNCRNHLGFTIEVV